MKAIVCASTLSLVIILLALLSSCAQAHDWMTTPAARDGANAQTTEPCEALAATSPVTEVMKGQSFAVSWANNHKTGMHNISIAPFGQDTTIPSFRVLASVPASQTEVPQIYNLGADVFSDYAPGSKYTLRWSWESWANCATVRIAAAAPADAVPPAAKNLTTNPVTGGALVDGDYIISENGQNIGVFNVYSQTVVCASGYMQDKNNCIKSVDYPGDGSGMTPGGKAALALFLIALFGVAGFALFSYITKKDALFYVRRFLPANKHSSSANGRKDANYVAYSETDDV